MPKVAVFASGGGSNFKAIRQHLLTYPDAAAPAHRLCCLVSDKPDCGAVAWARSEGIPVVLMAYAKGKPRETVETALLADLGPYAPDLLVLAGFMRLLTPVLIDAFQGRLINIHPALLPRHPGAHGIAESYASGDQELGITIHHVDYGVDTGPIIVQRSFERTGSESLEEIEGRLHALEHDTYPQVVAGMLDNISVTADGGIP
jgi:phosphoribosylglycinamide formyltransferase-1